MPGLQYNRLYNQTNVHQTGPSENYAHLKLAPPLITSGVKDTMQIHNQNNKTLK